ncbi:motile sperm domain-containing protein 2-like [Macrobrachium rosenbergii]|uniref:motile sperm domain-containing protein 2-like n=1 Tax=Macrobrachium rosenbergii TaxID=79674 RepID=UPI0034D5538B
MSPVPPEPSQAEIDQLRSSVLQKVDAEGESYDTKDIEKIQTDDKYIRRFLMHHDNDQKLSLEMVMDTLKWRKDLNVNNITKESLPQDLFDVGALFIHNRDKDNCKMLIFSVRLHQKGVVDMDLMKRFLIYFLERLEREENGEQITVFFDMTNTGMKNMDMDLIQYMINLFKSYYPWFLNYIIVFEMPWLLSAMWKIIKNWLPPKAIDKIKFLDRKSLKDYVNSDQALTIWGGTDDYEYEFEPEVASAEPVVNGDIDSSRKVHFAEESTETPASPLRSKPVAKRTLSGNGSLCLEIEPSAELMFNNCRIGATANITITNPMESAVAFKIKTTSPEKFRVKPSVGILEPGHQIDIGVTVSEQLAPSALVRDKFLVMGSPASSLDLSSQEISQLFKSLNKDDLFETRLRVGVSAGDSASESSYSPSPASTLPAEVISKLDQLLHRQSVVEEQLRTAKKAVYLTLVFMVVILIIVLMVTNNMTSTLLMYTTSMHNAVQGSASAEDQHQEL